ncbi:flagellar hook-basal body complex protein FliE [candidate division GN15 bacterium]|uniref:Flagellar hook-basal body complex protein FliE n=1 Tax=candidate division GN15 bacterium TaxID=2072418 RepID=A0A855WTJ3_9BACT|nr:MAG: flagellar hook-basal body complex protein FliE [candidate division GN15 bacterium]
MIVAGISSFNKVLPGMIEPSGRRVLLDEVKPTAMGTPGIQPPMNQPPAEQASFGEVLSNAINSVNQAQMDSAEAQKALLNGEPIELHDVMIKAEEAGLTLDLMLEIRNKLLNGYNELIHMPM